MTSARGRLLLAEKNARTLAVRFQEIAEMARHHPEIGRDKDPILLGGEGQTSASDTPSSLASWAERKSIVDLRRRHPLTIALWRLASVRKRIIGQGFAASASPQAGLLPQTLKRHVDFGAFAFRNVRFHVFLASNIEGDRPINLLEAQYRIM
jgi:hypothetical protein